MNNYKPVVKKTNKVSKLTATALVGVNSLSLGWTLPDSFDRKNLLGFGIRRTDFDAKTKKQIRSEWFYGNKRFAFQENQGFGINIPTYLAPFQRFNWNDYTLSAGRTYKYEIVPFAGDPQNMTDLGAVELNITPSDNKQNNTPIGIFTNRGVTSAHAYLERFKDKQNPKNNTDAQVWLSRGLKESLLAFIQQANQGDGLHVAIYEFEDKDVAEALEKAKNRGVEVMIVYHANDEKQKKENEELLEHHHLLNPTNAFARTNTLNISHNKFVILLKSGQPKSLWTGTCNFTFNGFYLQTNMALEFENVPTAEAYNDYFLILKGDPSGSLVKKEVENLIIKAETALNQEDWKVKFSPVSQTHILDLSADLIKKAKSSVFLSAPFGLEENLLEAINTNSPNVLEYGLCNTTAQKKIEGLNAKNTRFFVPSVLKTYMGQQWDAKAFGSHKIHTKSLVIDAWSDNPKIIVGTANFSEGSCNKNDENFMLIEGDKRLAAVITTEFIRMWEHYKNRAFINDIVATAGGSSAEKPLSIDGSWSKTAFDAGSTSYKFRERIVFSGGI